jgi:hypothetical protein
MNPTTARPLVQRINELLLLRGAIGVSAIQIYAVVEPDITAANQRIEELEKARNNADALEKALGSLPAALYECDNISVIGGGCCSRSRDTWLIADCINKHLKRQALTPPKEARKERCGYCQQLTADWLDPDWAKDRICRECYNGRDSETGEVKEPPTVSS